MNSIYSEPTEILHLITHRARRRLSLSLARFARLRRRNTQPRCWSCRTVVAASSLQCAVCVRVGLP